MTQRTLNRQKQLKGVQVQMLVVMGKIKESIDLAEQSGITPKEYGKLVKQLEKIG